MRDHAAVLTNFCPSPQISDVEQISETVRQREEDLTTLHESNMPLAMWPDRTPCCDWPDPEDRPVWVRDTSCNDFTMARRADGILLGSLDPHVGHCFEVYAWVSGFPNTTGVGHFQVIPPDADRIQEDNVKGGSRLLWKAWMYFAIDRPSEFVGIPIFAIGNQEPLRPMVGVHS